MENFDYLVGLTGILISLALTEIALGCTVCSGMG